jgi:ferredoxin-NADP reductase
MPEALVVEPRIAVLVAGVEYVTADILHITLAAPDGVPLPKWEPGSHIEVALTTDLIRQYSLCGDADSPNWCIAVHRESESRGGSAWIHDNIHVGQTLTVSEPRARFPLVDAPHYLFVAGVIGITPILAMIDACDRRKASWRLVYTGRSESTMAFTERLRRYGPSVSIHPTDAHGRIDVAGLVSEVPSGTAVFCCGPSTLVDAVESEGAAHPEVTVHVERFRPRDGALSGTDTEFDVILDETGVTVRVGCGQSILDALESAGIHVPTSCREGTCGTCETVVLEGIPDHRDSYLTAAEQESNEVMMVCCSRSTEDVLVLDL